MKEIKIKTATYVDEYKIHMAFDDGKQQTVDFGPFLSSTSHPEISKYLDKKLFQSFSLEDGDIMWNDYDLIFPISDLYMNSIMKIRRSQEAS